MTVDGWLRRRQLVGVVWVLEADDGTQYELRGLVDAALLDQRVTVEGEAAEAGFGFNMVGPIIDVKQIEIFSREE